MSSDESIPSFLSLQPSARRSRKGTSSSRGAKQAEQAPQLAFDLSPAEAVLQAQPAKTYTPIVLIPDAELLPAKPVLYTVRELINEVRQHVEGAYRGTLHVEGEISNCRAAASGHVYFTLKDGDAQLPAVLFRKQAQLLSFKPKDGLAVEVRGRLSVYETRGQLQLIAESLRPRGTGALQLAFEQLRDRLRREGLFDRLRTPLPPFPHCIGIVTSPSGAAIRDIIQVIRRRHARLNILIYPAVMQGPQCASAVAAGIRWFNRHPERVDLIVLARGGGSLEDLAGFNDEALARTIVASALPVVSAIGHEIDHTIADFVADLRAPTPSAAAELITSAQHRIEERILSLERRVHRAGAFHLLRARQRFERLSAEQVLARLYDAIGNREQRIDELRFRLAAARDRALRQHAMRASALETRLLRHDPGKRLAHAQRRHATAGDRLQRVANGLVARRRTRLAYAAIRLHALSPFAVLNRGYAIVYLEAEQDRLEAGQGKPSADSILRDASQASPNQRLRARLAKGSVRATITETTTT